MKFEKLSEVRLKITLYAADMQKWNVSYDNLLSDNPDTSIFFREIITLAEKQTGIKFENCRLTVEVIRESESTCVMILSKKSFTDKKMIRASRMKKENDAVLVFSFDNMDDISLFAKNNLYYCFLFDGKNSLYRDGGRFLLSFTLTDNLKNFAGPLCDRLCEYADMRQFPYIYSAYLDEHTKVIIKDSALKIVYFKL